MRLAIVVAMDKNNLIGVDNHLPWRLPDDMAWFKQVTMGKPVIMGRKTYESIPVKFRPLSGRTHIILTRHLQYTAPGCLIAHSVEEALLASHHAEETMIAGGAEIYQLFFPLVSRLYLTIVDHTFPGDTFFPAFEPSEWREVWQQKHEADLQHLYPFSWYILEK